MKPLIWVILAAAAFVAGLAIGVWTGGRIEQDAFVTILTHESLSEDCREEIQAAAKEIIDDWHKDRASPQ